MQNEISAETSYPSVKNPTPKKISITYSPSRKNSIKKRSSPNPMNSSKFSTVEAGSGKKRPQTFVLAVLSIWVRANIGAEYVVIPLVESVSSEKGYFETKREPFFAKSATSST